MGSPPLTWRNFYLTGAAELREGVLAAPIASIGGGVTGALTVEQLFDSLAVRIDGARAWAEQLTIDWTITDVGEHHRMHLSNGALVHWPTDAPRGDADLTVTLTKPQLLAALANGDLGRATVTGDPAVLRRVLGLLVGPDPNFPIVTP